MEKLAEPSQVWIRRITSARPTVQAPRGA